MDPRLAFELGLEHLVQNQQAKLVVLERCREKVA